MAFIDRRHTTSFAHGVRAVAGASLLAAVGFPALVLAIATPVVLLVAAFEGGLTWLTRSAGLTSPLVDGVVGVASLAGGVFLSIWVARRLVNLWRRRAFAGRSRLNLG